MSRYCYYIFAFLFLCGYCRAYGQLNPHFSSYTVADGLPQSTVESVAQDRDGYLWIGTEGGLARYDGYAFKTYRHNTRDAHSLIGDKSIRLYLDSGKQFWVITYNGISLYNPATDNFTTLLQIEPRNVVTAWNNFLGEDKQYIYAGICEYGIIRVDKQTHRISKINIPLINHVDAPTSWYYGFLDGNDLWIAANQLTIVYNLQTGQTRQVKASLNRVANLNISQAIGTTSKGAVLIDKKSLATESINFTTDGIEPGLSPILKLSDTLVLLGSVNKGLYYFNVRTKTVTRHIGHIDDDKKTPLSCWCLGKDLSGNLWIGSNNNGVVKMEYPYKRFTLYRSNSPVNNIISLYADGENLYAGNAGTGLDIFSRKGPRQQSVSVHNKTSILLNTARAVYPLDNGRLLAVSTSTVSGGAELLYTLDIDSGKVVLLNKSVQQIIKNTWGNGNLRYFIFKDKTGNLITNAGECLITLKQGNNQTFSADLFHRFAGENLSSWFYDNAGNLWIGTYKGVYQLTNGSWKKVVIPRQTEVKTISQDNAGNMWLGTNFGIYVLNSRQQVINYYNEGNALLNEHLYGLLKDDDGNMWFSSNKGISVYDVHKKTFRNFSMADDLQSDEFNASAYFKAADGELFFGGINGTTAFYPKAIRANPNNPKPNISNILLFDKPLKTDSAYTDISKLTFPYTDNSLSFEFSLPEYSNPQKNQYAYTMIGVDKQWLYSGNTHFARYPGLQPGHYLFKVKAANNDGVWGEPHTISINIVPPFWQRSWFIFLMVITSIAIVAAIAVLLQRASYRKKLRVFEVQQRIQSERERISRDLHDNIGTQLSLINKSIKEVTQPMNGFSDEERARRLTSAQLGSVEVIDVLRETIWALNKPEITLEEFADNLKTFVQKKLKQYTDMSMEFSEDENNERVSIGSAEALNLFRICQEAITNAIKYASATMLHIAIKSTKGKYQITIADNGKGFNIADLNNDHIKHYGLENMKHRANDILCTLDIQTAQSRGTTVLISKK